MVEEETEIGLGPEPCPHLRQLPRGVSTSQNYFDSGGADEVPREELAYREGPGECFSIT